MKISNFTKKQVSIKQETYNKLLDFPTTLTPDEIKDIKVYQYYLNGTIIDCINVVWTHKYTDYYVSLNFSKRNFNKNFN